MANQTVVFTVEEIVAIAGANRVDLYTHIAPTVVLLYEFFILLPDEVSLIWSRRKVLSVTIILYFLNRYAWLVLVPFAVATKFLPMHENSCHVYSIFRFMVPVVVQLIAAGIFVMRIFALFECNRKIIALCVVFAAVLLPIGIWGGWHKWDRPHIPIIGCNIPADEKAARGISIAYGTLMAYECILFVLTVIGVRRHHEHTTPNVSFFRRPETLSELVLRDGLLYYLAVLSVGLVNQLVLAFSPVLHRMAAIHILYSLTVVLTSRLVLRIRQTEQERLYECSNIRFSNTDTSYFLSTAVVTEAIPSPSCVVQVDKN